MDTRLKEEEATPPRLATEESVVIAALPEGKDRRKRNPACPASEKELLLPSNLQNTPYGVVFHFNEDLFSGAELLGRPVFLPNFDLKRDFRAAHSADFYRMQVCGKQK